MINLTVERIAEVLNGKVIGDSSILIESIKPIENAGPGDISFYYHEKYKNEFQKSNASCLIISNDNPKIPKEKQAYIKVERPYNSFVTLLQHIEKSLNRKTAGIHASAVIGENCEISSSAAISAGCIIGDNVSIGDASHLKPGVVVYDNVKIGSNTIINSNVTVYQDCKIGNNCFIYAGAVIGSDGFGYIENKADGSYEKVPQLGNVILEDFVEIGANSTIDRALVGSTVIGKGSKLDNLVHVAHNCVIGENTGIAAQTGVSGSVFSGKRNRFGGQVGIAGHLEIADDVTILAQSGVSKSITKSGIYFGSPVKEHLKAFKIEAVLRRLPELAHDVDQLKNELKNILEKLGD
ncbi:MAG: UDP-3-O-(3-hydroxymyristoyl)glucosamine N-acyltransferase [Candidatus Kapabacteria bacterium]|nr:UDP-3-O-(3-hydroxymyristoyl)glucosamine N-acyltransferase [Ignavibacteriota bacterium]MCW5883494.1 UDP-3-O-(3-hydroxymyristoyl)glucosamine N-acyltransferase [Candidatus Kapabacteria bacterium]